jgi:hypothetical protein
MGTGRLTNVFVNVRKHHENMELRVLSWGMTAGPIRAPEVRALSLSGVTSDPLLDTGHFVYCTLEAEVLRTCSCSTGVLTGQQGLACWWILKVSHRLFNNAVPRKLAQVVAWCGRWPDGISTGTPTILVGVFSGFSRSLEANSRTVP